MMRSKTRAVKRYDVLLESNKNEIEIDFVWCAIRRFIPNWKMGLTVSTNWMSLIILQAKKLKKLKAGGKKFVLIFDQNKKIIGTEFLLDVEIDALRDNIRTTSLLWTVVVDDNNIDQLKIFYENYECGGWSPLFMSTGIDISKRGQAAGTRRTF